MKKRIFAFLMCVVLMIGVMPAAAITDDASNAVVKSGEYGENISWQLTEDGTLTISGEGAMEEYYDYNENPWREFEYYEIDSIVINEGITKIGAGVFTDVQWYSDVYIPASVTEIETSNFWYTRLYGGFYVDEDNPNYSNDENGNLYNKDQTKLIQASESYHDIYFVPAYVTEIDRRAFFGCEMLEKFIVDAENEHFSTDAKGVLYDKDKTRVVCIPDGMTGVVTIPASVTEFEWAMVRTYTEAGLEAIVFEGDAPEFVGRCKDPEVVYYPENNDTWTDEIFEDEYVTWVSYDPADPVFKPYGEFGDGLTWELKDGVLTISGEGEVPYNECPWADYTSAICHIVYEEGITQIACCDQFRFCENLISVSVPASTTFLDYDKGIGLYAFYSLGLDKIIVAEDNPNYCSDENGNLYSKDKTVLYKHLSGVDDCYVIPEYVTTVYDSAFVYENLVEVRVHENVEAIGMYAFSDCSNLARFVVDENNEYYCSDTNGVLFSKDMKWIELVPAKVTGTIVIPASVKEFAYNAFFYISDGSVIRFEGDAPGFYDGISNCTIYYPENNPTWTEDAKELLGWENTWIGYVPDEPVITASGKCGENLTWELTVNGTLVISGEGDMYDFDNYDNYGGSPSPWFNYGGIIEGVIIRDGVTSIGAWAFEECLKAEYITIPETVTKLGDGAISYCNIRDIHIPASVTEIGRWNFCYCMNLEYIWVERDNPNYSSDDNDCLFNKDMTELICVNADFNTYTVPASVERIRNDAFINACYKTKRVVFEGDAPEIDEKAFYGLYGVTVCYPENNSTWTDNIMKDYGGEVKWVEYTDADSFLGDVNIDGKITNADLIMVAQYIVWIYNPETVSDIFEYGDMNGDDDVTNTDLIMMARTIVGLD